MSRFSDLLNDFAEKKHASTAGMAAYCDSDRTTIYRFRRGTRTPESPAMVETMADYMQLTLSEKQDLLKAYEITMAGEGNYFRRQAVREFMGSFKPFGFSNSLDSSNIEIELPSFDPSMMKLATPIHGRDAVYQVINNALSIEGFSRSVDKRIDLIMDPTEYKVMESVRIQGRLSPDLKVRHIFAMNSRNARVPEGDTASLDTLQAVLSSCSDGFSYEPHYYYRDQVLADPFPLQGGLLVSTFWALTFSDDLSCGVFYDAPHLVAFFRQQFENILRSCPRMVRRAEDFSSFVEMTSEMQMFKTGRSAVQYMPQMCMLSVLTEHQISRHLKVPADAESLRTLSRKLRQPDGESALQDTTLIATLGGIRRFLQTGKLDELSDDMYTPLGLRRAGGGGAVIICTGR